MKKQVLAAAVMGLAAVALPGVGAAQTAVPGWYLGLEAGPNWLFDTGLPGKEKLGGAGGGIVGYDWVGPRTELEVVYRNNKVGSRNPEQIGVMANVLYDFFAGSTITPYVGAGIGYMAVEKGAFKGAELGYQGIAGLGWNINTNWRANLDARYFATTDPKTSNGDIKYNNNNVTAMLGVTYKLAAPAPAPAPVTPPPAVQPKYIVFFDFDRSDITATAQNTISQAAASAKAGNKTRIGVTGHADRSGSDQYNMALSLRRANAVKDALVRQGIPANQITVVGRGETQPLVNTADGVREPQNRRVEIVLE